MMTPIPSSAGSQQRRVKTEELERARSIVAGRVEEAFDVLRRMPDRERSMLAKGERGREWPVMLHQAFEHAAHQGIKIRLPPPSAAQITRMHEVLAWMLELAIREPGYAKVVYLVHGKRFGTMRVARIVGIDKKTVARWLAAGLTLVVVDISRRKSAA